MPPRLNTGELISEALDALRAQTGLKGEIARRLQPTAEDVVVIRRGRGGYEFKVYVEPWLNRTAIALMKERYPRGRKGWLLVTRQVTQPQAEALRLANLPFLDTAGNAFVKQDDLYVFIRAVGRERGGIARVAEIYRPAELRVLFAFLCINGLEGRTHEQINVVTGAGLGTINRLIHGLTLAGYLIKLKGHKRRLVRKEELLERWVTAYPQRLRPKQVLGRFTGPREPWWEKVNLTTFGAQWGGEIAANLLTHYLNPQLVTIYTEKQPHEMVLQQRLRKDPLGEVEILKRFWHFPTGDQPATVVPALLVYADLLATGDDRNIETARMIHERFLA